MNSILRKTTSVVLGLLMLLVVGFLTISHPQAASFAARVRRVNSLTTGVGELRQAFSVTVDNSGNVYVADTGNHRIVKLDSEGKAIASFGHFGKGPGEFNRPGFVKTDAEGNIFVADLMNYRVQKFSADGTFLWEKAASCVFGLNVRGDLYEVVEAEDADVEIFDLSGKTVAKWSKLGYGPNEMRFPHGIVMDANRVLYITDFGNHRIMKYTIEGEFLGSFGKYGTGPGEFKNPYGIAIDSQERLWIVDTGNRRVQVFNTDGTFLSSIDSYNDGSGKFVHPKGIAIGPNQEVWIADPGENAINVFPMGR